ncbi:MAG: flagellar basal body rod protein FlgB [Actinomycetota bacterium]
MDIGSDITLGALEYALNGLAQRGDVRANNMANANTPGFQASKVSFEGALEDALRSGDISGVSSPSTTIKPGLPDGQGNTVSMEDEMIEGIKDNLGFQTYIQGYNFKLDVLRKAIGGQG